MLIVPEIAAPGWGSTDLANIPPQAVNTAATITAAKRMDFWARMLTACFPRREPTCSDKRWQGSVTWLLGIFPSYDGQEFIVFLSSR